MLAAQPQGAAVQLQHRGPVPGLGLDAQPAPLGGLRQPGYCGGVFGAESVRCGLPGPRDGHAAAVTASVGVSGPLPDGVLEHVLGQVLDLGQAQFLTLVDVGPAGQGEHEQGGRAGAPGAQFEVRRALGAVGLVGGPPLDPFAAVAAGVAHDVVVGQHPGGRCAHGAEHGEGVVDDRAQVLRVPTGHQEVEVEGRVHVGGEPFGGVGPGLGDERPVAGELVGHCAPGAVDVVDLVTVPVGVVDVLPGLFLGGLPRGKGTGHRRFLARRQVGQFGVLDESVGDVDAEPVHTPAEPETQDRLELPAHVGVLPVEVGLLRGEQVQIPLAVGQPGPGRAAEAGDPVIGRFGAVGSAAGPEDVPLAFRAAGSGREGGPEPGVLVGGVVGHDVGDDADPVPVRFLDEVLGLGQGAEERVDGAVVRHVVTVVRHRRLVPRVDPNRVDAERPEVGQPGTETGDVADTVAVRVGETADVDLVDDGAAPPRCGAGHGVKWALRESGTGVSTWLRLR